MCALRFQRRHINLRHFLGVRVGLMMSHVRLIYHEFQLMPFKSVNEE